MIVKRILDPAFRYRPSYDTNVRETFEKARREQERDARPPRPAPDTLAPRVVKLERQSR